MPAQRLRICDGCPRDIGGRAAIPVEMPAQRLSICDQGLVQPERLRELREKVATAYMDTLKWEVQWVKRVREERRRLEDADR